MRMIQFCSCPSGVKKILELQSAFDVVHLTQYKLVWNADKSKSLQFPNGKRIASNFPEISTAQGVEIEMITAYKYFDIIIDQNIHTLKTLFLSWNLIYY